MLSLRKHTGFLLSSILQVALHPHHSTRCSGLWAHTKLLWRWERHAPVVTNDLGWSGKHNRGSWHSPACCTLRSRYSAVSHTPLLPRGVNSGAPGADRRLQQWLIDPSNLRLPICTQLWTITLCLKWKQLPWEVEQQSRKRKQYFLKVHRRQWGSVRS